jgi:hypothetical protein
LHRLSSHLGCFVSIVMQRVEGEGNLCKICTKHAPNVKRMVHTCNAYCINSAHTTLSIH